MKRTFFTVILIAVGLVAAIKPTLAFGKETKTKNQSSAEQEILKLEKEWYDAFLGADIDTLNRIEADDFIVITRETPVPGGKKMQLAIIKGLNETAKKRMASMKRSLNQVKIRIYGDIIIVNGVQTQTSSNTTGEAQSWKSLYTGVWAKRDGRWQILNAQWTDLPEQKPKSGN